MKKLLCLVLICALCAATLCACKKRAPSEGDAPAGDAALEDQFAPDQTPVPAEGSHGEEDQSKALESMPTLAPVETVEGGEGQDDYYSMDALLNEATEDEGEAAPDAEVTPGPAATPAVIDVNSFQFSALTDTALGFTFNYPSQWKNIPGVYTVCFRESVEPGDFPARIAISVKKLVHTPEENVMTDELTSYVRVIKQQYESKTFQLGTPNTQDTFMGKPALSNTYLAFSGETEVKGFIIGCAVGRRLYVLHFCASYEDYTAMESVMRYMVNSVALVEKDKD